MGNRGRKGQPDGGRRIGWNPGSYRRERRAAHTRTDEALTCPRANRRAAAETLGFAVDSSRGLASGDESISDLNRKNPGEPDHPCRCRVNVQADAISSQATQAIHELVGTHARMFSARLQAHRQQLFPPTGRKTLRKFTSGEAARLIGTDDGVLRRLSLSGKGAGHRHRQQRPALLFRRGHPGGPHLPRRAQQGRQALPAPDAAAARGCK